MPAGRAPLELSDSLGDGEALGQLQQVVVANGIVAIQNDVGDGGHLAGLNVEVAHREAPRRIDVEESGT